MPVSPLFSCAMLRAALRLNASVGDAALYAAMEEAHTQLHRRLGAPLYAYMLAHRHDLPQAERLLWQLGAQMVIASGKRVFAEMNHPALTAYGYLNAKADESAAPQAADKAAGLAALRAAEYRARHALETWLRGPESALLTVAPEEAPPCIWKVPTDFGIF